MHIRLTRRAATNFLEIKNYIRKKFGEPTADQFAEKVDDLFSLLKIYPNLGQIENNNIRGFQLTRQTRVLYRVKNESIIILALFDVRQDPSKKV